MPLYEYDCEKGHRTPMFRKRISEMNDPLPCATCGGETKLGVSLTGRGIVTGSDTPGQKTVLKDLARVQRESVQDTMVDWKCEDGHVTVEVYRGEIPAECLCETCGKPTKRVPGGMPMLDTWTREGRHAAGGYYDAQLGRWINSPSHLREVMAEMQVQEGGDDRGALLRQAEAKAKADAQDRVVFEMLDQLKPDVIDENDRHAMTALKAAHPDW